MQDKVNYISPETFEKIINYIPVLGIRKWKNDDIKMLYKTMYYCALRANEAISLKKESFNLVDREIYLGKTKTKKQDTAHIPHIFVNELTLWLSVKEKGRLFEGLTYDRVYHWCRKIGLDLDISAWQSNEAEVGEKVVTHLFRKSIGKEMLNGTHGEKASAIPVISKHLRHAKPSMTVDHYLKASLESVKEAW
jgi:integrase